MPCIHINHKKWQSTYQFVVYPIFSLKLPSALARLSYDPSIIRYLALYVPTLNKQPDGLIIHCGTNNLRSDEPEETAKKIVNVALAASRTVRSVAVSSILARGDSDLMESKRVQVNNLLERSLETYGIDFIKHENFDENWQVLLYDDGIHLNQRGTNVLGGNIVKFLKLA